MAGKAINAQKDTPKVDRKIILLNWTTQRTKAVIDPTTGKRTSTPGNEVTVSGATRLYYSAKVLDWFSIPEFTPSDGASDASVLKTVKVKTHNRLFYSSIDDATGKNITVPEFERIIATDNGAKSRGKSVIVPLGENKITAKGNPRTVSLLFPRFFNNIMIAQGFNPVSRIRYVSSSVGLT